MATTTRFVTDDELLQAGGIDPERRTAAVYRSATDVRTLGETDSLDGEDVVPGFLCPLKDVLDR